MASDLPKGGQRRRRTKFDKNQYEVLLEAFERDPYPGITIREELAAITQIPEPRIQVWFQNRRTRIPRRSQRSCSGEASWAQARAPGPGGPGVRSPRHPAQLSFLEAPSDACCLRWESGDICRQAVFPLHPSVLGVNTAPPNPGATAKALCALPAAARRPASCSGSAAAPLQLPASPQPFSEPENGDAGTGVPPGESGGTPEARLCLTHWGCTLPGEGPRLASSGQQPSWGWSPLQAAGPGMAPQQPLPQNPGVWEQLPLPPPQPQQPWHHPVTPPVLLWRQLQEVEVPAEHQEQFPSLPPREHLCGEPRSARALSQGSWGDSTWTSCCHIQKVEMT